jgi:hypothetical protein
MACIPEVPKRVREVQWSDMGRYGDIVRAINRMRTAHGSTELHATIYFPLRRECRMFSAALYAHVRIF